MSAIHKRFCDCFHPDCKICTIEDIRAKELSTEHERADMLDMAHNEERADRLRLQDRLLLEAARITELTAELEQVTRLHSMEQDMRVETENKLRVAKAQIAMLRDELTIANDDSKLWDSHEGRYHKALYATSADAEAWLREEKAKVLEDAAIYLDEHCCATGHITSDSTLQELQRMAAELLKNGGK